MSVQIEIAALANDIRGIYAVDPQRADLDIERFLEEKLKRETGVEKIRILDELQSRFNPPAAGSTTPAEKANAEILVKLCSLVLGGKVTPDDLTSAEFIHRLAESLNTVFDNLNQLVGVINTSFLGREAGDQTIRHVIGIHLEGDDQVQSMQDYLGQINKAFLVSREAFRRAAEKIVSDILNEFDPEKIGQANDRGLAFGPMRKAQMLQIYEETFRKIKKWFDSDRFKTDLMHEFERQCQQGW
jgi:hypothetical protein